MMTGMSGVVEALQGRRLIVELPAGLPEWLATCEVLLQERLGAWAFPLSDAGIALEAMKLYGRRTKIGIRGLMSADQVRDADALGVHFLTSPVAGADLLEAAPRTPLALGALTPNEVRQALALGAQTVGIVPAASVSGDYLRIISGMFPDAELIVNGELEPYQCTGWREAGGAAVALTSETLFADFVRRGNPPDLETVRRRAQQFTALA